MKNKLPLAFAHRWSMEALQLVQPPLRREFGDAKGQETLKQDPVVGPDRGAKGWYSGDCDSVDAYLNSLKKARIT